MDLSNKIDNQLFDVKETIDELNHNKQKFFNDKDSNHHYSSPGHLNSNSGDIITDDKNENDRLSIISHDSIDSHLEEKSPGHIKTKYSFIVEHPLTNVDSRNAILIEQELGAVPNKQSQSMLDNAENQIIENIDDEQNIVLPQKIDLKDLNPYEFSEENVQSLVKCHLSLFNIEYSTKSTSILPPEFLQNSVKSINSFQQLCTSQVHTIESINSNTLKNILSILWSLIIIGFNVLSYCAKFLQYDTILFAFYYFIGALFGANAYFLIDFLLIITCIISIFLVTYEKWLIHCSYLNEYENENQYGRRIKLAAYGVILGTILNSIFDSQ